MWVDVQKVDGQENHCEGSRWEKRWRGSRISVCGMDSGWLGGWVGVLVDSWTLVGWTVGGRKEASEYENGCMGTNVWVSDRADQSEGGDTLEAMLPSPGPSCLHGLGNPFEEQDCWTSGGLAWLCSECHNLPASPSMEYTWTSQAW